MHGQSLTPTSQHDRMLIDLSAGNGDSDYELGLPARSLDLQGVRGVIQRYWKLMLGIFLLALAAGAASIIMTAPVYRATASIHVEPQAPRILASEDVTPDTPDNENDRLLQTQVDLLASRSTARNVATQLRLGNDPSFLREAGVSAGSAGERRFETVVTEVQQGLSVTPPSDSTVIAIHYDSHNPEFAAKVANAYADTFINDSLQRRLNTYAYSRRFLQSQFEAAKVRLERSEKDLVAYARAAGLVNAGELANGGAEGGQRSITTSSLVDLNSALSQARAARLQAQNRWREALATPILSLPDVLQNPSIQNLTRQRAELEATLQQERGRRQDQHPAILQARAQIAELDRQIGAIAGSVRASIANQYRVAAGHESGLQGHVNALKSATFDEQSSGVRYNILKRQADANRNLYNTLLQRYHEVSTMAANTTSSISVVDRASAPASPTYPKPAMNMALAGAAGIVLAFGAGFIRNRMDNKVHGPADVESRFHVPLLGVVPLIKNGETVQQALTDPISSLTESHHVICLALDPLAQAQDCPIILVTSSCPGEGKSTTTLKLAAQFAAAEAKVLLIDGDMRRGTLHVALSLPNIVGLAETLSKDGPALSSAVQYDKGHGVYVLTSGRPSANPAELLSGKRFARLLDEAARAYDLVLIDGPPVLGLADAPRLSRMADATVFIVEANQTSKDHVKVALQRLIAAGANQIGVVLSKYDPAMDSGSYSYGYQYQYGAAPQGRGDADGFASRRGNMKLQISA